VADWEMNMIYLIIVIIAFCLGCFVNWCLLRAELQQARCDLAWEERRREQIDAKLTEANGIIWVW
jgi:hypothetical protein